MLKLYYATGTISIAVAIALAEAGLPHTLTKVDFSAAEQTKPDYLAINPKGRVPALVLDDGTVLTETGALMDFIADLAPNAKLMPADPREAAHVRSTMYYLASTMHVAHAHRMRGSRWASQQTSLDDMAAKVPQTMAACASYIETESLRGRFVLGDTFSVADPYLFVVCNWLAGDGVDVTLYPQIQSFLAEMESRPSVQNIRAKEML